MLTSSRFFLASLALTALVCAVLAEDESSTLSEVFGESESAAVEALLASEAAAHGGSFGSAVENYQGALALSLLSSANLAKNKAALCKAAGNDLATAVSSAGNVDLAVASEALKLAHLLSCDLKDSDVDAAVAAAKSGLGATTPIALHQAVSILASTKRAKVDASDVTGVFQAVVDLQKEDGTFGADDEEGTLDNAGHALQTIKLAAGLSKPKSSDWDTVSQIADKANNLVDTLMQNLDEASLVATVQVFDGLNYLATTPAGEKVSIARENVALIADNLIAVKSAPASSEAGYVVHGLQLLANNKFSVVPAVTVLTKSISAAAKGQEGVIKIRVTDILGKPLGKTSVHLNSASLADSAVVSNVALKGSDSIFELNLASAAQRVEHGTYTLDLRVSPVDSARAVAAVDNVKRTVRVTTSASISGFEVSIQDAKSGSGKQHSAEYPKTFGELSADYLQAIEFSFTVRSQVSSKTFHPHQAFVRFSSKDHEAIFVTRVVDRKQKVKVVVADAAAEVFKNRGGVYDVEIIVGDTHIDEAIVWQVGKISLTFADDPAAAEPSVKPELHHTFRAAEKRPPAIVSLFFTGLILASFLVLLSLISRLNIGLRLPSGDKFLPTAAFHIIIGLILALYVLYWLKLNMFECLTFLAPLSAAALVVGSKVLS